MSTMYLYKRIQLTGRLSGLYLIYKGLYMLLFGETTITMVDNND